MSRMSTQDAYRRDLAAFETWTADVEDVLGKYEAKVRDGMWPTVGMSLARHDIEERFETAREAMFKPATMVLAA